MHFKFQRALCLCLSKYADGHTLPIATEGLMPVSTGKADRARRELDTPAELGQVLELPGAEGRKAGPASKVQ